MRLIRDKNIRSAWGRDTVAVGSEHALRRSHGRVIPLPGRCRQELHSNFCCVLLLLAGVIAGGADVARLLYDRSG